MAATFLSLPPLSFTSSYISNGASAHRRAPSPAPSRGAAWRSSLSKLSSNLERLLVSKEFDCSDAEIVVEGRPSHGGAAAAEGKPRYQHERSVPQGNVRVEAFKIFLGYLYTGKLKPSPPRSRPAPMESVLTTPAARHYFAVELMYASSVFQIPELISLLRRRWWRTSSISPGRLHCGLSLLQKHCIQRVSRSDLESTALVKELPPRLWRRSGSSATLRRPTMDRAARHLVAPPLGKDDPEIYRALDSDDVELLLMLLQESSSTLDDANALHYAVAYCDSKVIKEILPLEGVDTAVTICRRLTRAKDYNSKTGHGEETNKDRLCIEVFGAGAQEEPHGQGGGARDVANRADDLHMKLLYLENRDPIMLKERLQTRMEALRRTVELGKRYFPNCSQVVDKFMDDDHRLRMRFHELKEDVRKAFHQGQGESSDQVSLLLHPLPPRRGQRGNPAGESGVDSPAATPLPPQRRQVG
ncbi:unnamed protein product [Spirodela intermedia]|uniref:NPR1/NIM1-like C-terminal domain-containing protein n=1 Tax=Spirodela intermedia TaxID=51605 RepID=A0ABN7E7S3_SPIIN|nr:unnamed protein product [Spirodela intermedia]